MPSGIRKDTGKANCELRQCVEAKIAAHKGRISMNNKMQSVLDYVQTVLIKPLTISLEESEGTDLTASDLAVALLNINTELVVEHLNKDELYRCLDLIFYRINPYLPAEYKVNRFAFNSMNYAFISDQAKDGYRVFIDDVLDACNRIEDMLTKQYFVAGGINKLEILKRRYRKNWGDQQKSLEVKASQGDDKSFEVIIRDA